LKTEKFFTNFPHYKFFQTVGAKKVLWDILEAMKIGFRIQKLPKFTKNMFLGSKLDPKKKVGRKSKVEKVGIPPFYMP
jgi:hypothetical protein